MYPQNNVKVSHIKIWLNYYRLVMLFLAGDFKRIGNLTETTDMPSDYIFKMVRYFTTGKEQYNPMHYAARDSYTTFVDAPKSSFSEGSQPVKATINNKLSDKAITAYRQLIAKTSIDSNDDMMFLSFVSALFVASGYTWEDVRLETLVKIPAITETKEIDGEELTILIEKERESSLLDVESDSGESYFQIAKNLAVTA